MGGEALLGQGFAATACLDTSQGQPGVKLTGTFNPQRADSLGRYGINIDRPGISFIPEQYTGGHSRGLNSQAVALLPLVFAKLDRPVLIEPNATRDQADLDMLVGATAWVIQKAIEFKLLAPPAPVDLPAPPPPVPPPVQPPSPPPVAPPPAGSGLSAPEQRVDELWAWIGQQWPTVRPVAVAALKMFRKAVGR